MTVVSKPARIGVVLVEYHSAGQVAERAAEALALGCTAVVADNVGDYEGPGIVVRTGGNIGFGAGCNRAVDAMPGNVDVIVFQNPDIRIPGDQLLRLGASIGRGWIAVAPSLRTTRMRVDGFSVPNVARELPLVLLDVWRASRASDRGSTSRVDIVPFRSEPANDGPREVPGRFASGALLAVERTAFENVGGFDERYFLYVEDLDLWERLDKVGQVGFLPSVVADHFTSSGSEGSALRRTLLRWLGRELYFDSRGLRWRSARLLHRFGSYLLPSNDHDPVVQWLVGAVRGRIAPEAALRIARSMAVEGLAAMPDPSAHMRAGWSRTRIEVLDGDLVLDVGSGAFPSPRADVLCERSLLREHRVAVTDRPTVVADAHFLPFRTGAFELAIASHLAEHVERPDWLCSELGRVASRWYLETPSAWFERLFPTENHIWRVRRHDDRLVFGRNEVMDDVWRQIGRKIAPAYFAGTAAGWSGAGGVVSRLLSKSALVLRGLLNRCGATVTRIEVRGSTPVAVVVADSSGPGFR